jgi:hypothetical protein
MSMGWCADEHQSIFENAFRAVKAYKQFAAEGDLGGIAKALAAHT